MFVGPEQPLVDGIQAHLAKVLSFPPPLLLSSPISHNPIQNTGQHPLFRPLCQGRSLGRIQGFHSSLKFLFLFFPPTKHSPSPCFSLQKEAKLFMAKHKIPTARFGIFTDSYSACEFVASVPYDVVVKARSLFLLFLLSNPSFSLSFLPHLFFLFSFSGLAAGKGVIVPKTKQEAKDACVEMLDVCFSHKSSSFFNPKSKPNQTLLEQIILWGWRNNCCRRKNQWLRNVSFDLL